MFLRAQGSGTSSIKGLVLESLVLREVELVLSRGEVEGIELRILMLRHLVRLDLKELAIVKWPPVLILDASQLT